MADLQTFTLPAGSVCHRNGLPFVLQHATQVECHPGNWRLISGTPPSTPDADPADAAIEAPKPLPSLSGGAAALAEGQALRQEVAALYAALQSDEVRSVAAPVSASTQHAASSPRRFSCLLEECRVGPESWRTCCRTSAQLQADCQSTGCTPGERS